MSQSHSTAYSSEARRPVMESGTHMAQSRGFLGGKVPMMRAPPASFGAGGGARPVGGPPYGLPRDAQATYGSALASQHLPLRPPPPPTGKASVRGSFLMRPPPGSFAPLQQPVGYRPPEASGAFFKVPRRPSVAGSKGFAAGPQISPALSHGLLEKQPWRATVPPTGRVSWKSPAVSFRIEQGRRVSKASLGHPGGSVTFAPLQGGQRAKTASLAGLKAPKTGRGGSAGWRPVNSAPGGLFGLSSTPWALPRAKAQLAYRGPLMLGSRAGFHAPLARLSSIRPFKKSASLKTLDSGVIDVQQQGGGGEGGRFPRSSVVSFLSKSSSSEEEQSLVGPVDTLSDSAQEELVEISRLPSEASSSSFRLIDDTSDKRRFKTRKSLAKVSNLPAQTDTHDDRLEERIPSSVTSGSTRDDEEPREVQKDLEEDAVRLAPVGLERNTQDSDFGWPVYVYPRCVPDGILPMGVGSGRLIPYSSTLMCKIPGLIATEQLLRNGYLNVFEQRAAAAALLWGKNILSRSPAVPSSVWQTTGQSEPHLWPNGGAISVYGPRPTFFDTGLRSPSGSCPWAYARQLPGEEDTARGRLSLSAALPRSDAKGAVSSSRRETPAREFVTNRVNPNQAQGADQGALLSLAQALRIDSRQAQSYYNQMGAVMTVQNHNLHLMAAALQELREELAKRDALVAELERERRRAVLESRMVPAESGATYLGGARRLDSKLKQAERQLSEALDSTRAGTQVDVQQPVSDVLSRPQQSSFFAPGGSQIQPNIPEAATSITTSSSSRVQLKKKRTSIRGNPLHRDKSHGEDDWADDSDKEDVNTPSSTERKAFSGRKTSKKKEQGRTVSRLKRGKLSQLGTSRDNKVDSLVMQILGVDENGEALPFNMQLAPDLQKVLLRDPSADAGEEGGKGCRFVVVEATKADGQEKDVVEIAEVRALQEENVRSHEIVKGLERRVASLYAELRVQTELAADLREANARIESLKKERDNAMVEGQGLRAKQQALEREIHGLRTAIKEFEDTRRPFHDMTPMVSLSSESSSLSGKPEKGAVVSARSLSDSEAFHGRPSVARVPAIILPPAGGGAEVGPAGAGKRYSYSRIMRRAESGGHRRHREHEPGAFERIVIKEPSKGVTIVPRLSPRAARAAQLRGQDDAGVSPIPILRISEFNGKTEDAGVINGSRTLAEIEALRKELELERSRSLKAEDEQRRLLSEKEKLQLDMNMREERLRAALEHQTELKNLQITSLQSALGSHKQILNSLLSGSRGFDVSHLSSGDGRASTATPSLPLSLARQIQAASEKEPVGGQLDSSSVTQEMQAELLRVRSDSQQQIDQLSRQLTEKLTAVETLNEELRNLRIKARERDTLVLDVDRLKQQLTHMEELGRTAQQRFAQANELQSLKMKEQARLLLEAADEIRNLRAKVGRTADRDDLARQLDTVMAEKQAAELKVESLDSKLRDSSNSFQNRLEESRRALEMAIAERDRFGGVAENLRLEVEKLNSDLRVTTDLLERAEKTIIDLSPETRKQFLCLLAERLDSSDNQISKMREQIKELEKQRDDAEHIRDTIRSDLVTAKQKLDSLELSFTAVSQELERKSELLGEERGERLHRECIYKETQLRNNFVEKCLVEHVETIRQKDEKIRAILKNREAFKEALAEAREKCESLEKELTETEMKLFSEKALTVQLNQTVDEKQARIVQLMREIEERETQITEAGEKLSRADLILIRRTAELDELTKRFEKKVKQVEELEEQATRLQSQVNTMEDQLEDWHRRHDGDEKRLSLTNQLELAAQTVADDVQTKLEETQEKLNKTTAELTALRDETEVRKNRMTVVQEQLATMRSELEKTVRELNITVADNRQLRQQIALSTDTKKRLQENLMAARGRERQMTENLQAFGERLDKALAEKDTLISNLTLELNDAQKKMAAATERLDIQKQRIEVSQVPGEEALIQKEMEPDNENDVASSANEAKEVHAISPGPATKQLSKVTGKNAAQYFQFHRVGSHTTSPVFLSRKGSGVSYWDSAESGPLESSGAHDSIRAVNSERPQAEGIIMKPEEKDRRMLGSLESKESVGHHNYRRPTLSVSLRKSNLKTHPLEHKRTITGKQNLRCGRRKVVSQRSEEPEASNTDSDGEEVRSVGKGSKSPIGNLDAFLKALAPPLAQSVVAALKEETHKDGNRKCDKGSSRSRSSLSNGALHKIQGSSWKTQATICPLGSYPTRELDKQQESDGTPFYSEPRTAPWFGSSTEPKEQCSLINYPEEGIRGSPTTPCTGRFDAGRGPASPCVAPEHASFRDFSPVSYAQNTTPPTYMASPALPVYLAPRALSAFPSILGEEKKASMSHPSGRERKYNVVGKLRLEGGHIGSWSFSSAHCTEADEHSMEKDEANRSRGSSPTVVLRNCDLSGATLLPSSGAPSPCSTASLPPCAPCTCSNRLYEEEALGCKLHTTFPSARHWVDVPYAV